VTVEPVSYEVSEPPDRRVDVELGVHAEKDHLGDGAVDPRAAVV
jgi:hypothetical protein